MIALDLFFQGRVQGVGFRPFVLSVARPLGICGWVQNTPQGVTVHAEASAKALQVFLDAVTHKLPSAAKITSLRQEPSEVEGFPDFEIHASLSAGEHLGSILPDLCLCEACRLELFDSGNRRFFHPFISCTHCGPRFSILQSLPYDRPQTSMGGFPMCARCQVEYENPLDRRFHAQPICCPDCGPKMWCEIPSPDPGNPWKASPENWLALWALHTEKGGLSLVKGIGGFHLVADAFNATAVGKLREVKQRDRKPFALMVPNLEWAKTICTINPAEELALLASERPIVILDVHTPPSTMAFLAPGLTQLGIMLPNSPVHELFFSQFPGPVVLTSANRSSEPMLTTNDEARAQGRKWCDMLVLHDRDIVNRADDGVVAVVPESLQTISLRIGRGASPREFRWPQVRTGLAFGADLKNTIALAHHGRVTLSQHIGDMEHPLTQDLALQIADRLCASYRVEPQVVVCDAHPEYFSSQLAQQYAWAKGLPLIRVPHHHAHIAATWLEHQWHGPALGLAFDGTGYGEPDCIWGSEVMHYSGAECHPLAHLQPLRLPGGDRAMREPVRILLGALHDFASVAKRQEWLRTHPDHAKLYEGGISAMLTADLNCPASRGMGRLFDLVGAMLDWQNPTWDGETGTRLENLDVIADASPWPVEINDHQVLLGPIVMAAMDDVLQGASPAMVSSRLHSTVCELIIQLGLWAETQMGITQDNPIPWVFAGGVFQNRKIVARLQKHSLIQSRICYFSSIPNDNGIALGQIVVATHLLEKGLTTCA
jgi:hydrogenase maturation protein HypF